MRDVEIRGDMIRLGQLLKLAGLVDSGAEAKHVLGEGRVQVNGEVDARRGRQLHGGDNVTLAGAAADADEAVRIVTASG